MLEVVWCVVLQVVVLQSAVHDDDDNQEFLSSSVNRFPPDNKSS